MEGLTLGSASEKHPHQRSEAYEEKGCGVCGTKTASSFRRHREAGRLCNSCHCKAFRLRRKMPELTGRAAVERLRALHARQQQAVSGGSSGGGGGSSGIAAGQPDPKPQLLQVQQALRKPTTLAGLQQGVFEDSGSSPSDVATVLHCAMRAQQSTPFCPQRVPLGVLPKMKLQLPDDPPGMTHPVCCLLEAVAHGGCGAGGSGGGMQREQSCDSQELLEAERWGIKRHRLAEPATDVVAVRLTVFAAAGAVACWHEGPPVTALQLAFSPLTKSPIWSSGPGGFTLHFPSPFCSQIDLFATIHSHVARSGLAVLQQPGMALALGTSWEAPAAEPWPTCPMATSMPPQQALAPSSPEALGEAPLLRQAQPHAHQLSQPHQPLQAHPYQHHHHPNQQQLQQQLQQQQQQQQQIQHHQHPDLQPGPAPAPVRVKAPPADACDPLADLPVSAGMHLTPLSLGALPTLPLFDHPCNMFFDF